MKYFYLFILIFLALSGFGQCYQCPNNQANAAGSSAFGSSNISGGINSVTMGLSNNTKGAAAISIGSLNSSNGANSFAAGESNTANGNNSFALGINNTVTGNNSFAIGNGNSSSYNESFSLGYFCTSLGTNSVAIGYKANAGRRAFAIGNDATATDLGCAIGNNVRSSTGHSFAFGKYVQADAVGSIVIGASIENYELINRDDYSLMVGFLSNKATLYVGSAQGKTGKVGIGTIDPKANLHILSESNENASLFVESGDLLSGSSSIFLGSLSQGIDANPKQGLIFNTTSNYLFNSGKIGIGTEFPEALLHLRGGDVIFDGNLSIGSVTNLTNTLINGKVGINSPNPLVELEVNGNVSIGYNVHQVPGTNGLIVNGPVGIGTFAPSEELEVVGKIKTNELQIASGYMNGYLLTSDPEGNAVWVDPLTVNTGPWQINGDLIYVNEFKKIGIGTSTPQEALDVNGNIKVRNNIIGARTNWEPLKIFGGNNEIDGSLIALYNNVGQTGSIKMYAVGSESRLEFHVNEFKMMDIRPDNSIVFGNPNEEGQIILNVNGAVNANLMKVQVDGWWDSVFDDDYALRPISELERYISENKHLPDMPTENQVKADGLNVAEMNALLLKKVEELTLYIIELEKKVNTLAK